MAAARAPSSTISASPRRESSMRRGIYAWTIVAISNVVAACSYSGIDTLSSGSVQDAGRTPAEDAAVDAPRSRDARGTDRGDSCADEAGGAPPRGGRRPRRVCGDGTARGREPDGDGGGSCADEACAAPTCDDGIANGRETDVD